jgi:hypothetical protein
VDEPRLSPRDLQPLESWLRFAFALAGVAGLTIGVLMFVIPGDAGVGSGPPTGPPEGDQWWPWPLRTELITRYIAAFVIGFGVASLWCAFQRVWGQVRVFFPLTLTSHGLIIVGLLLHTDSFDAGDVEAWLTFGLYPLAFLIGFAIFVRYEWSRQREPALPEPEPEPEPESEPEPAPE